jgi:hypothetical protein
MDVPWTMKEVLRRKSHYMERVLSFHDFDGFSSSMFCYARETFGRECGIRNLGIEKAWIGNGRKGYCWALPPTMNPACRSSEDTKRLNAFLKIVGYIDEPVEFYSTKSREPSWLRKAPPIPQMVEDVLLEACYRGFESGAILRELSEEDEAKANRAKLDVSLAEGMAKISS